MNHGVHLKPTYFLAPMLYNFYSDSVPYELHVNLWATKGGGYQLPFTVFVSFVAQFGE